MSDTYPDPDVPEQDQDTKEKKEFRTTAPINIKGRDYVTGETVFLSDEEHEAAQAAGVRFEGDDEVSAEDRQSRHEEGVSAQNELIKQRAEKDAEQLEKLSARAREDEELEIEEKEALERAHGNKAELLGGRGGVQGRVPGERDDDALRSQGRRPEGPQGVSTSTRSAQEQQRAFDQERADRRERETRGKPRSPQF